MSLLWKRIVQIAFVGVLGVTLATAQDSCPAIVEDALIAVEDICADLGRNQACYGNLNMEAELTTSEAEFENPGDIVGLEEIETLTLEGMDTESSVWGISLISMQASLPETLPGQNVTFVLFGDVSIVADENAGDYETAYDAPLQAFYFTSGIGDASCEEAPQSGLLVQTPDGAGEVFFVANGVEIALGSTAFLQAEPDGEMIVSVVEGQATLTAFDETIVVPAGTQSRIELDEEGLVMAAPQDAEPYDIDDLIALPLVLLEREVEIAEPLGTQLDIDHSESDETDVGDSSEDDDDETAEDADSEDVSSSGGAVVASASGGFAGSGCSVRDGPLYTFTVVNDSDATVSVVWLSYECSQVTYHTIAPGESASQETFPTHPWIIVDDATGETIFGPWEGTSGFTITVTNE